MKKMTQNDFAWNPWIWGAIFIVLVVLLSCGHIGWASQLLFSLTLMIASLGLFLMHVHFRRALKEKEDVLAQSFYADCQQQLRTLRHQHRNQLQILTGYLEMGMVDEGLDYLNRMASATHEHRLSMELPELEMEIYHALKVAKGHGIQMVLELHRIQPSSEQLTGLCSKLPQLLELTIGQLAYVRSNELINGTQPQMIHISSGMELESERWFLELFLEGMPLGASRVLVNKLSGVMEELASSEIGLSYELKASQMSIKLDGSISLTSG